MNDRIDTEVESPGEKLKKLSDLSPQELKDQIVTAYRRLARAESDKKHYVKAYNEVIKEEKEVITELVARLEFVMESDRLRAIESGWLAGKELGDVVADRVDAAEQGDKARLARTTGFARTADGTEYNAETGEIQEGSNVVPMRS